MIIPIPYGKTRLTLHLPDDLDIAVLNPRDTAPHPDPESAVREALEAVDWSRFAGARTAAIAISDKTRPVPHKVLLLPLLERLTAMGIEQQRITLVIATGCHPPMTPDEFPHILPAEIIASYRVISHNIDDEDGIIRLGLTKHGTVVSVNRTYFEANLRLVVGNVEPHQFVGFSGGAKGVVIGLAGWDTINGNHRMMTHPNAALGHYQDNPIRQDIEDMGRIVNVHLALNTLLNQERQIVRVFCGPPLNVMRAAIPYVRQVYELPVEQPFDLVIASPGGHPKDINLYQAQKALGHAALVTRPGGAIILAAACPEGSGSRRYEDWIGQFAPEAGRTALAHAENPHQAVIDRFTEDGFSVGPHKAYQIARDSVNRRVIWVTDLADPARFLLESAASLDDALARVLDRHGQRVGVLPYANATIPVLAKAASETL